MPAFALLKKVYIKCKLYKLCKDLFVYLCMFIIDRLTGKRHTVVIEPVLSTDYKSVTKPKYFFNWKTEKKYSVYKLRRSDKNTILGLISLINHLEEQRIEIKLLAVSIENRGKNKQYEGIAGTLIGYACREAMKDFGAKGCVSLLPKTELKRYYITQYGMTDAGYHVFLEGISLLRILNTYKL